MAAMHAAYRGTEAIDFPRDDTVAKVFLEACRVQAEPAQLSTLVTADEWQLLEAALVRRQLIDPEDVQRFRTDPGMPKLPLDLPGFWKWLSRAFFKDKVQQLGASLDDLESALLGTRCALHKWGAESWTQDEMYKVQILYDQALQCVAYNGAVVKERIEKHAAIALDAEVHQEMWAAVKASNAAKRGPERTGPEQFQFAHGAQIEKRLRERKVGHVSFKAQPPVLEETPWGFSRVLARVPATDEEVEVWRVPWDVLPRYSEECAQKHFQVDAIKCLSLSPYFAPYWGSDFIRYAECGLHFFPRVQRVPLKGLVQHAGVLQEKDPLFKYWAGHLVCALRDYLYQCPYSLTADITLEHVFLENSGLKLMLHNLPFGDRRGTLDKAKPDFSSGSKLRDEFCYLEQRLSAMLGAMLLEMLYADPLSVQTLQDLSATVRCLIFSTTNSLDSYERKQQLLSSRPPPEQHEAWPKPYQGEPLPKAEEPQPSTELKATFNEQTFTLQNLADNPYFSAEVEMETILHAYDDRFQRYKRELSNSMALTRNLARVT